MTWIVAANEIDESVSVGVGSATEDSSMGESSTGSGTARELELGGAEHIDKSVSEGGKSNCLLDERLGGAGYIEKFQQVVGL